MGFMISAGYKARDKQMTNLNTQGYKEVKTWGLICLAVTCYDVCFSFLLIQDTYYSYYQLSDINPRERSNFQSS